MRIPPSEVEKIRMLAEKWLQGSGVTVQDVTLPSQAWHLLHASGAYMALEPKAPGGYPVYNDAHIETALRRVFPNAFQKGVPS